MMDDRVFGGCRLGRGACFLAASVLMPVLGCDVMKMDPPDMDPDDPPVVVPDVAVTAAVTPVGDGFRYDYSVTNNTDGELVLLTIPVPADESAVTALTAPMGFLAVFDATLGLVDFVMDEGSFSGMSTVTGFSFESPFGSGAVDFTATDSEGVESMGATQAPVP